MERARPSTPAEFARNARSGQRVVKPYVGDGSGIGRRGVVVAVRNLGLRGNACRLLFALFGGLGFHALFFFAHLQRHNLFVHLVKLFLHRGLGGFVFLFRLFGGFHFLSRFSLLGLELVTSGLGLGAHVLAFLHKLLVLVDDAFHGIERSGKFPEGGGVQDNVDVGCRSTRLVE